MIASNELCNVLNCREKATELKLRMVRVVYNLFEIFKRHQLINLFQGFRSFLKLLKEQPQTETFGHFETHLFILENKCNVINRTQYFLLCQHIQLCILLELLNIVKILQEVQISKTLLHAYLLKELVSYVQN